MPIENIIILLTGFIYLVIFFSFIYFTPLDLWLDATLSEIKINPIQLFKMFKTGVPPRVIIENAKVLKSSGIKVKINQLESHYRNRGHIPSTVKAIVSAKNANIDLDFNEVCKVDLSGRDAFEAIYTLIYIQVLNTDKIIGTFKDSSVIEIKLNISLKGKAHRILDSQREDYIISQVRHLAIQCLNKQNDKKYLISNPDILTEYIFDKMQLEDYAFEIIAINVDSIVQ